MAKVDRAPTGAMASIMEAAAALHRVGAINQTTMREFDALALPPPEPLTADAIKGIRQKAKVNQTVFARYLGTSESTIEKWETGAKVPSGMARRLLSVVARHGIEVLG
jgi:putative transcriptional regulator